MVYVDTYRIFYGLVKKSHIMIADTTEELIKMAYMVGVDPDRIENKGKPKEYLNLTLVKRKSAIRYGAKVSSRNELIAVIKHKQKLV